MAILLFGPLITGARGKMAGLIFSANKSGPYARSWSRSSNPRTPLQADQRGILTDFATNWRNLTQVERDGWDTYAADPAQDLVNSLGETYSISGFAWYVRINTHLALAADAPRTAAPTLARPSAPVINNVRLRITGSPGASRINYTPADPALGANHVIFARVVNSQGIVAIPGRAPLMTIAVPDVNRNVVFQTEVEAAFGTIALGQRILATTRIQDADGQRGPADTAFADAEA